MDLLVSQQLLASASDIEQEYYEGLSAEERKYQTAQISLPRGSNSLKTSHLWSDAL